METNNQQKLEKLDFRKVKDKENELHEWYENDKNIKKDEIDIVFLAMSTLNKIQPCKYMYTYKDKESEEETIEGAYIGQLELVVKMLAEKFHYNNKYIDYVYVLNTDATDFENENNEKKQFKIEDPFGGSDDKKRYTPFEFFKERCGGFIGEIISILLEKNEDGKEDVAKALCEFLNSINNYQKKINLYIDIHGGPRETFAVIDAIMMLVNKINNINLKDVFNIRYDDKNKITTILSIKNEYQVFDFVSGINEFLNFGRSDSLVEYNDNVKANKIKNKNDDAHITKYLTKNVPVKDIDLSPKYTNSNDIKKFAKEIEDNGLKNPIVILQSNKSDKTDKNKKPYKLLIGNKRLYTYGELLKKDSIEAYVAKDYDDALVYLTNKISDGILLNRTNNFQDNLQDLSELLELKDKNNDASFYDAVSSLIKDNYIVEINGNKYNLLDKKDVDYFPAQLQWCIDKKHYQQALVLIENRTAGVLCDQDILITNEEEYTKMSKESDVFVEWVNYSLFTYVDKRGNTYKYVFKKYECHFNNIHILNDNGGYIGDEKLIKDIRNQFENINNLPKTYNQRISDENSKNTKKQNLKIPVNKDLIGNEFLNDLYILMFTYYGLKKYRNTVAHPNKDIKNDLSINEVEKWMHFYINFMAKFISKYGNKKNEKVC